MYILAQPWFSIANLGIGNQCWIKYWLNLGVGFMLEADMAHYWLTIGPQPKVGQPWAEEQMILGQYWAVDKVILAHQCYLGIYASYSRLSQELKNSIKIKVDQAVLVLLIQTQHFDRFDLLLKNWLAYSNFNAIFEFLEQFFIRCIIYFSKCCCWLFWDREKTS